MRLFKAYSPQLLLAACVSLFGARAGFAQSNGDQLQSSWYCENVTDYAQFCDFVIGVSTLTIDATGAIATSALTEPVWGFHINMTQCRAEGGQQLSDCIPYQPGVSATVKTTISPSGISGSGATSGSAEGSGEVQLELPTDGTTVIQADQTENTYTETSTHSATFNPPGNEQWGQTSTDVVFDGPYYVTVSGEQHGTCPGCQTTVDRVVDYQVMTYSGKYASTIWVCEAPNVYNWSCSQHRGYQWTSCSSPYSATSGIFDDEWTLASDSLTPVGCGFDLTDPWMWAPTKQITTTVATLSGYVHTNSISINGSPWPPTTLTGYTICPSGATFNPQDITVSPCN